MTRSTESAPQHRLPRARTNMRVTMAHRVEYLASKLLFGLFGMMGLTASSWLAGHFLRYVGPMVRSISRRGEDNLRLIYPEWSDAKIMATIRDVWENLGRTSAEFSHLDKFQLRWDMAETDKQLQLLVAQNRISTQDTDLLKQYKSVPDGRIDIQLSDDFIEIFAKRKPTIFVTGHFANWEILSVVCDKIDVPCAIVYRAANNALVDQLIIETRAKTVRHRQIPKGPDGARALIDALKDQYSLGLLMDQKFTDGLTIPFMGQPATTASAAARMALRFDMPVIPVAVTRHDGIRFTMTAHDQIRFDKSNDLQADIISLTTQINEALERNVRANPGQWLWLHRRWGKLTHNP